MSEIKPIADNEGRTMLADALPLVTPFSLYIVPTVRCNFRCNYCAQSLDRDVLAKKYPHMVSDKGFMTMELFRKVLAQAKSFPSRFKMVSIFGQGEPLLHPDLPEMVAEVRDAGIAERIEFITNGSLLTPDLSRHLIDAGLTNIRVSLQGLNSRKYREVCGVELDFEKFKENIAYYYAYGREKNARIFVKIMDVALEENEEKMFYSLFDSISDRMYIERVKPVYDGIKYEEALNNITMDRYGVLHTPRKVCPLPFYMLNVWPDGDVSPCDAIYKPYILGNCNNTTLLEMWRSDGFRSFLAQNLRCGKNSIPICTPCCAPDDVSHPADVLDDDAKRILPIFDVNFR
ncbi:radical SAM protein [Synergistales bacterium]|nr:radical SAM protein [Synergistales bacterium]